jgi:hypothetical protein
MRWLGCLMRLVKLSGPEMKKVPGLRAPVAKSAHVIAEQWEHEVVGTRYEIHMQYA